MARSNASEPSQGPRPAAVEPARLARADRRDLLLDAAADLVAHGDIDALSMEAVAERARVSRPLVYKHFANRSELLVALYRRESALLHAEIAADVAAAETLEAMFRALIHGSLRAQSMRGATFLALRHAGSRTRERRDEQRSRDRTTLRYFTARTVDEFGLDPVQARAAVAILLSAVQVVLVQWRVRPTAEHARELEDTYVALVMGGLERLARP